MTTVTHAALERIRRRSLSWHLRRLLQGQFETFASGGLDRLRQGVLPVEGPLLDAIETVESGVFDGRAEAIGGSRRTTSAVRSFGSPSKTRAPRSPSLERPARRTGDDSPRGFPIWPQGTVTPLRGSARHRPTFKSEADRADHLEGVDERIHVRRSAVALAGATTIVNPTSAIDRVALRRLASSVRQLGGPEPRTSVVPRSPTGIPRTEAHHPAAEPDRVYAAVNDRGLDHPRSSDPTPESNFGPALPRRPQNLAELVEWADHHDLNHHPVNGIGFESQGTPTGAAVLLPTRNATIDHPEGRSSGDPTSPGAAGDLAWAADVVEAVLLREARMHGVTVDES